MPKILCGIGDTRNAIVLVQWPCGHQATMTLRLWRALFIAHDLDEARERYR